MMTVVYVKLVTFAYMNLFSFDCDENKADVVQMCVFQR